MTLRERVARWLCEYVGGEPDMADPHVITHEGKPFEGPLWQVFVKDADELIPIILAEAAKVLTDKAEEMRGTTTGNFMARIFEEQATAIERLGER
jgi:hypothetical protein